MEYRANSSGPFGLSKETVNHGPETAIHGPDGILTASGGSGVWVRVTALERSIEAVEKQQMLAEAAMRRRTSLSGLARRVRSLFIGGTVDDQRTLEDNLKWLRKKEEQLRKEKILLMQNEIFTLQHAGRIDPELTERVRSNSDAIRQPSYFSSPRSSSAAAAAFAAYSAALTTAEATASSPVSSSVRSSVRRQQGGYAAADVRTSSRSSSGGGISRGLGSYFKSWRRLKGRSEVQVHSRRAYASWWNDEYTSADNCGSVTSGTSPRGHSVAGSIDFGARNPIWERTSPLPSPPERSASLSAISRVGRIEYAFGSNGGRPKRPLSYNAKRSLSWRQVWGFEGKSSEESADSGDTVLASPLRERGITIPSSFVRGIESAKEADLDKRDTSREKKQGVNHLSSSTAGPSAASAPKMMRGSSQRNALSASGQRASDAGLPSRGILQQRRPEPTSKGTSTSSLKGKSECAVLTKRSSDRKVRFDVPSSPTYTIFPILSPSERSATSEAVRRSAADFTAAAASRMKVIPGDSATIPHPHARGDDALAVMSSDVHVRARVASLVDEASEDADTSTVLARRKFLRRASSDEGPLNALAVVHNEVDSLMLASDGAIKTAEQVAAAAAEAAALWAAGAYSPTVTSATTTATPVNRWTEGSPTASQPLMLYPSQGRASDPRGLYDTGDRGPPGVPRGEEASTTAAGTPDSDASALRGTSAAAQAPPASTGSLDPSRDTLERTHNLLTSTFALMDTEESQRSRLRAAAAVAKGTATAAGAQSALADTAMPPPVWVTRYVDRSTKYGLGFLLSDGTVGARFNDATKITLRPGSTTFEYVERPTRGPPSASTVPDGRSAAARAELEQHLRRTYKLDDYPSSLDKKVRLLKCFRQDLDKLSGDALKGSRENTATDASSPDASQEGPAHSTSVAPAEQSAKPKPAPVVERWRRTRHSCLFVLSSFTIQVVFSDKSQILLSELARVVTFVDKAHNRETLMLSKILEDQRSDIIKRIRYSKDLILQMLTRGGQQPLNARPKRKEFLVKKEGQPDEEVSARHVVRQQ